MLNAIAEIESFISIHHDFSSFQNDIKTKRAVERNIEIIGEAMSRILTINNSIELSSTRKIVDTRNRIIHGYNTVSDEIIWNIAVQHLPILKQEIMELIN